MPGLSGAVEMLASLHPEQRKGLPPGTEVLLSEQGAGDGWVGVISKRSKLLQLQQESFYQATAQHRASLLSTVCKVTYSHRIRCSSQGELLKRSKTRESTWATICSPDTLGCNTALAPSDRVASKNTVINALVCSDVVNTAFRSCRGPIPTV